MAQDYSNLDLLANTKRNTREYMAAALAKLLGQPNHSLGGSILNGLAMGLMGLYEGQDQKDALAAGEPLMRAIQRQNETPETPATPQTPAAPPSAPAMDMSEPKALSQQLLGKPPGAATSKLTLPPPPPTAATSNLTLPPSDSTTPLGFSGDVQAGPTSPGYNVPRQQVIDYIRQAAIQRGIDPDVALKVARSEGLANWQSTYSKNGVREQSYGPFQLYTQGGMGNDFQKATGLDPSDPNTWKQGTDFALDQAAKNGWGPWYGARRVGITGMQGIGQPPQQAPLGFSGAVNAPAPQGPPQPVQMAQAAPQPQTGSDAITQQALRIYNDPNTPVRQKLQIQQFLLNRASREVYQPGMANGVPVQRSTLTGETKAMPPGPAQEAAKAAAVSQAELPAKIAAKGAPTFEDTQKEKDKAEAKAGLAQSTSMMVGNLVKLDQMDAIHNYKKGMWPNVWAGINSTDSGQAAGTLVGQESASIRQSVIDQRAALINNIRQATGMSAKALDSNAELQFYQSMIADPKKDIISNLAGLEAINKRFNLGLDLSKQVPADLWAEVRARTGQVLQQGSSLSGWGMKEMR